MFINSSVKQFNTDNKLRVGIISDSQLSRVSLKKETLYEKNLFAALTCFKKENCDMIIFAGDICDFACPNAYKRYIRTLDKVFTDKKPIIQAIMGNHDYYNILAKINGRRLFKKYMHQSPFTHFVVNGYHFIGASPMDKSMDAGYKDSLIWIKEQLDTATADTGDAPIFLTTHNAPENTVYGSEDWGDTTLHELLKNYPNVVNFSGHSHYSLLDERSIYKGRYTALGTQSVSYTELESGKENGTIPPNADKTPMGYIMDFDDNNINLLRYNFKTQKEEKSDKRITLSYHINSDNVSLKPTFPAPPVMQIKTGSVKMTDTAVNLIFAAGKSDDFVHSYKVDFEKTVQYYFSDFINGIDNMSDTVKLPIYNMPPGTYNAKIYAVDSYNQVSENFTEINDITINKKAEYKRYSETE